MGTILKDSVRKLNFFGSVQIKFAIAYISLITVVLILINTYSLTVSRDLIFSSKQTSMQSQVAVVSTSLGALDTLTADSVNQVMNLLDVSDFGRVIIVGENGEIIYYASESESLTDDASTSSDIEKALSGYDVFYSEFSAGAFISSASTPIMVDGAIKGAAYIFDYDTEQGTILLGLQNNLKNISVGISIFAFLMIVFISRTVTRRITQILKAIKFVREGDYNYRVEVSGNDEIAQLGDEFNSLTDRLQTTDEIRRRFVSDASHELKTPLASIRLLSDSILQNREMEQNMIHEFVDDIGKESERLARTTEKLLALTKLDSNVVAERVCVDVAATVKSTLRMLNPLADSRMIEIKSDLAENCYVLAIEDDIRQIIFNLVENAIKYNLPGGSVVIGLRQDGQQIVLTVDDTGIGVPSEDLPNIFDRFYRVDKARSREAGGSGLGLSIVRGTVREHGGTVEAIRRPEGGMRFLVTFPACSPAEAAED